MWVCPMQQVNFPQEAGMPTIVLDNVSKFYKSEGRLEAAVRESPDIEEVTGFSDCEAALEFATWQKLT